jgi:hypothetical protein
MRLACCRRFRLGGLPSVSLRYFLSWQPLGLNTTPASY